MKKVFLEKPNEEENRKTKLRWLSPVVRKM
jgi:hypothetical protein